LDVFHLEAGERLAILAYVPHKDVVDNDLWSESWIMAAEWQATLSEFGQEAGFDVRRLPCFPL
jgi:hypothetical protein